MISCKRATELISKGVDEPLGRFEALQLRLHLYVCEFCVQFRRNVEILRGAVRKQDREELDQPSESDRSKEFKKRLKEDVKRWTEKP